VQNDQGENMFEQIPTIKIELLGQVNMYMALGIEITMGIILGGIIGFDREQKLKSAGIKTHILICLGATLYTAISLLNDNGSVLDPNRVSAQVVSGIGFLGAGAIIRDKGGIYGLTTAATIWIVAAVGVAIGVGYPLSAALFTITIMGVLNLLTPLYKRIQVTNDFKLKVTGTETLKDVIESYVDNCVDEVHRMEMFHHPDSNKIEFHYYIQCKQKAIKTLSNRLRSLNSVRNLSLKKLHNYQILSDD
jgi:putative Mg2+ transporter-C (MgtC) family protein